MSVSRASGKLEAALARFGLAGAVRGAHAVDVGASTGGFTQALLAAGAARVLAVDVGREQLHPALRGDPRVTSLEETDWRRLPLGVAEGPFDFFTVDVSFVAARNMLRGLAFRLRSGAEGVVLVKPQFELPPPRAGEAPDDERRRRAALDKVRAKAERLGFALVAAADSPVAGGAGTIEVLVHLRFAGRPETMPRRGERRPAPAPAARSKAAGRELPERVRWFAIVAPGLEEVAARELETVLGGPTVERLAGGVEWDGPLESGFLANLWARIPTRVVARVGGVEAREFGQLRRRAAKLPWRAFVPPGSRLLVRASATRCRLYHTGALAENATLAIGDAVSGVGPAVSAETADLTVLLRGEEDRFLFSVDASGERLHRRGARTEAGPAPLRETLASGMLALAGWDPTYPLVDPMCGTGTIPIEAASRALDRAPGLDRTFALERWPALASDPVAVEAARRSRDQALGGIRPALPAPIHGSDRDPRAVESARRNAERAGVGEQVIFACRDFADATPTAPSGLVITNPPYGRRLADPRAAGRIYRDLGRALRARFRGWRAAVLAPARLDVSRLFGLPAAGRFPLTNGGLPVVLHLFEVT